MFNFGAKNRYTSPDKVLPLKQI